MRRLAPSPCCLRTAVRPTASALAAPPIAGPVSATDIQGVSALLKGSVNPVACRRLSLRVRRRPVQELAPRATDSARTSTGAPAHPARAAISGLAARHDLPLPPGRDQLLRGRPAPRDLHHHRASASCPATKASPSARSPTGAAAATEAGSHPYQLTSTSASTRAANSRASRAPSSPTATSATLRSSMPPGLILNPSDPARPASRPTSHATHLALRTLASRARAARRNPGRDGRASKPRAAAAKPAASASSTSTRLRASPPSSASPPTARRSSSTSTGRSGATAPTRSSSTARNIPQASTSTASHFDLWGIPWAASHDVERGNCLNETEPSFPWAKCSVGSPRTSTRRSPTSACRPAARARSPSPPPRRPGSSPRTRSRAEASAATQTGVPSELGSCGRSPSNRRRRPAHRPEGLLAQRLQLPPPERQHRPHRGNQPTAPPIKKAVVQLPPGVTVNPSVGAGLGTCSPAAVRRRDRLQPTRRRLPERLQDRRLHGPHAALRRTLRRRDLPRDARRPGPRRAGAENPFDSLVAVYLVAKAPDRGVQVKLAGQDRPGPETGDLTATFDGLPQLPYTDLDINFRTGQRAFLVTPPSLRAGDHARSR